MIVLGVVAISTTVSLRERAERIALIQSTLNTRVMALDSSVWAYRLATDGLGDYMGDANEADVQYAAIENARAEVRSRMAEFEAAYAGFGEQLPDQYGSFAQSVEEYGLIVDERTLPSFEAEDRERYRSADRDLDRVGIQLGSSVERLQAFIDEILADETTGAARQASRAIVTLLVVIAAGALGGLVLGWVSSGRIKSGIVGIQSTIEAIRSEERRVGKECPV